MNKPYSFNREELNAKIDAINARIAGVEAAKLANVRKLANCVDLWLDALKQPARYGELCDTRERSVLHMIEAIWPDADMSTPIEVLNEELGIDEEGYPLEDLAGNRGERVWVAPKVVKP